MTTCPLHPTGCPDPSTSARWARHARFVAKLTARPNIHTRGN